MITRLTHTTLFVLDHEQALDFYVNKLGFTKSADITTPTGFRWLTVSPPKQPDVHLSLLKVEPGDAMSEEVSALMKKLLAAGGIGAGVFECDDCRATCADLAAKGVKFRREPADQFYGIDATIEDPFGNSFTLLQPKRS
ncbi:MAG TPA: VOC family protein [Chthonomonadales bacterium]|nr:VOC family protein [Chthonomonadales bacterium]